MTSTVSATTDKRRGQHRKPETWRLEERRYGAGQLIHTQHRDYPNRDEAMTEHAKLVSQVAAVIGLGDEYGPHSTRRLVVVEVTR